MFDAAPLFVNVLRLARSSSRGQLLPIMGLSLIALMGASALAVDAGYWRYQQRIEQTAADSAAIVGADELNYPASNDVTSAAQSAASTNGFTNGASNVTVTVNNPPLSGPHVGNASSVEVIVTQLQPNFFDGIFGINQSVRARAVATLSSANRTCMYGLNPNGGAVQLNGTTINVPDCGIISDSDLRTGLDINGSTITASMIGYAAGNATINGSTFPEAQPKPAVAASDPCPSIAGCAYLKANPPTGTCMSTTTYNGLSKATIPPGVYCSTLIINGCTNVIFSPGVYVFDAGLLVNGSTNVNGSAVTFYNASGSSAITINGSNVKLSAPTSGNMIGVLIYQNPANTQPITANGSGGGYSGMLYLPAAQLTINGSGSTMLLIVADTILVNGSGLSVPSAAFPGFGHAVLSE